MKQVPLVYVLISGKWKEDYAAIFEAGKKLSNVAVLEVVMDFEAAMWKGVREVLQKSKDMFSIGSRPFGGMCKSFDYKNLTTRMRGPTYLLESGWHCPSSHGLPSNFSFQHYTEQQIE